MTDIGFLAYGRSPHAILPPARLRALAAEARLQSSRVLLVSSLDCDPGRRTIAAETWSARGFVRDVTGLPGVVFAVNVPLDVAEEEPVAWLRESVPFIADPGSDKLAVAEWLVQGPLARHVIPFRELPGEDLAGALRDWLDHHGASVVKTAEGKRGSGLHFIDRRADGTWMLRHDDSVLEGGQAEVISEVCRRTHGRSRYRRYLVQRFIRSVTRDGRAVDLRVHVQRDGTGHWGVTRAYARLGEHGLPMSNISRGGYQGDVASFLRHRGRGAVERILAELHDLSLAVAREMEAAHGAPISELGVDVAIDSDDRLWLIEANTYPATSLHEQDRAIRTIGYALHVARGGGGHP